MPMALYPRVHSNEQFSAPDSYGRYHKNYHTTYYRSSPFISYQFFYAIASDDHIIVHFCVCHCLLAIVSRISLYNSLKCQLKNCELNVDVTLFSSSFFIVECKDSCVCIRIDVYAQ